MRKLNQEDYPYLEECLKLAEEALMAGDKPFGSILVNKNGEILACARNRVNEKNQLAHPEYALANWALNHLSLKERKTATMYTSGEHCPMCAGAHAWAEIGTVVYLASANQLTDWMKEFNISEGPIQFVSIENIAKNTVVRGPAEGELLEKIKELHRKTYSDS